MRRQRGLWLVAVCLLMLSACAQPQAAPESATETAPETLTTAEVPEETTLPAASELPPETLAAEETPEESTTPAETSEEKVMFKTQYEDPVIPENITRVVFDYDQFSGDKFTINAIVTDISADGARLELLKEVRPMDVPGSFRKEGEFRLDAEQTARLLEILSSYDIKGYSRLPGRGSSNSPSRSVWVFEGDERYVVSFDAIFPKTLPPQEDIMYYELFNFFNDRISEEPGWEKVRSENLEDPRENPAYGERLVEHFGHMVHLVPGTGTLSEDWKNAQIDYGDKIWWLEEGFTGTWVQSEEDKKLPSITNESAKLTVTEDGKAVLELDDEVLEGELADQRFYKTPVGIHLWKENGERRLLSVSPDRDGDYTRLYLSCYPGPVPETQFTPINVIVTREDPAQEETSMEENEMEHIPTLKEVKAINEPHGELQEIEWSSSSSGMMMGSYSSYSVRLFRENGELRLEEKSMPAYESVTVKLYSADETVFEKILGITEKENLAAWSYLQRDPKLTMMVYDYSSSSQLTLTYDDSSVGGWSYVRKSIDTEAATQQGGSDTLKEISGLLQECCSDERLLSEETQPNPYASGTPIMGLGTFTGTPESKEGQTGSGSIEADGTWTCGACGSSGNTGKFCPECGSRRPE